MKKICTITLVLNLLTNFSFLFAQPTTCAVVQRVNINTGINPHNGQPYSIGQVDPDWKVVSGPDNFPANSPVFVISPDPAWDVFPNAQWISPFTEAQLPSNNEEIPYVFEYCFCAYDDGDSKKNESHGFGHLYLEIMSDDWISEIRFNGQVLANPISPQNSSNAYFHFEDRVIIDLAVLVQEGENCLQFDLHNLGGVVMGVSAIGFLEDTPFSNIPLLQPWCCQEVDLSVTKDWRNDWQSPGANGWFDIRVTNNSLEQTATNIHFQDLLPPCAHYISHSFSSNNQGQVTFNPVNGDIFIESLLPGDYVVISIYISFDLSTCLNCVHLVSLDQSDTNPNNNSDCAYAAESQGEFHEGKFGTTSVTVFPNPANKQEDVIATGSVIIYPNPVSAEAHIDFSLSKATNLTIKVYDLTGKLVETLIDNAAIQAGAFSAVWKNPANTGIYLLKIKTEEGEITKRFSVVK